jgi:MarR family transcriptional regulator, 2-MHQ and catechol-resistance regulon repressor
MGHFKGDKNTARALDAFIKLMRASDSVLARTHHVLVSHDLSHSQFAVLEALYHVGPMCLSSVADKILKTSGNLTLVVKNLESHGLVRRVQDAKDRRYFALHLTPKGKALIARVFPEHARNLAHEMSALNPAEQVELARLCKKLGLAGANRN